MPSSRQTKRPEDRLPELFLDRSLGRVLLATALQEAGFTVHTLHSMYGDGAEERVEDVTWISDAAALGHVLLTKDRRILRVPAERQAVRASKARVFCLFSQKLSGQAQIDCFLKNQYRIVQRSRKEGPYVQIVRADEVEKVWP